MVCYSIRTIVIVVVKTLVISMAFQETDIKKLGSNGKGVIYDSDYEAVLDYFQEEDYEMAAELALSVLQLSLTGRYTSDSKYVRRELRARVPTAEKNHSRYQNVVEANNQDRIENQHLKEIALYRIKGYEWKDIADMIPGNIKEDAVRKRYNKTVSDFPWIIQEAKEIILTNEEEGTKNSAFDVINIPPEKTEIPEFPFSGDDKTAGKSPEKTEKTENENSVFRCHLPAETWPPEKTEKTDGTEHYVYGSEYGSESGYGSGSEYGAHLGTHGVKSNIQEDTKNIQDNMVQSTNTQESKTTDMVVWYEVYYNSSIHDYRYYPEARRTTLQEYYDWLCGKGYAGIANSHLPALCRGLKDGNRFVKEAIEKSGDALRKIDAAYREDMTVRDRKNLDYLLENGQVSVF